MSFDPELAVVIVQVLDPFGLPIMIAALQNRLNFLGDRRKIARVGGSCPCRERRYSHQKHEDVTQSNNAFRIQHFLLTFAFEVKRRMLLSAGERIEVHN
jgi:hypothetical protein